MLGPELYDNGPTGAIPKPGKDAIVSKKTCLSTQGVLTEVALGAPGRFAAFDDLVTLTVRAADGDERHGPFLHMRSYEDEGSVPQLL